jgi:hypothetical protein
MTITHGFKFLQHDRSQRSPFTNGDAGLTKASAQMHESVPIAIRGRNNRKSDFV